MEEDRQTRSVLSAEEMLSVIEEKNRTEKIFPTLTGRIKIKFAHFFSLGRSKQPSFSGQPKKLSRSTNLRLDVAA